MYKLFTVGVISLAVWFGAATAQDVSSVRTSEIENEVLSPTASVPITLPFKQNGGRPYVEATIGSQHVSLLLDLGANQQIGLAKTDVQKIGVDVIGVPESYKSFDGTLHSTKRVLLKDVRIGGFSFPDIDAVALAEIDGSFAGAALLEPHLFVLDYLKEEIRIFPSGDDQAMQRECGSARFPLDFKNGVFQSYVWNGTRVLTVAFDTGANFTVVRPSALHFAVAPYKPGVQPEIYQFSTLKFGEAVVAPLAAALIEFALPNVDVILGGNFFKQKIVCLDARRHTGSVR